jgi:hypothetical protein
MPSHPSTASSYAPNSETGGIIAWRVGDVKLEVYESVEKPDERLVRMGSTSKLS